MPHTFPRVIVRAHNAHKCFLNNYYYVRCVPLSLVREKRWPHTIDWLRKLSLIIFIDDAAATVVPANQRPMEWEKTFQTSILPTAVSCTERFLLFHFIWKNDFYS